MCISDCSGTGSNADAAQTLSIMRKLQAAHSDMGGMMFWDTQSDKGGDWSKPTYTYVCHEYREMLLRECTHVCVGHVDDGRYFRCDLKAIKGKRVNANTKVRVHLPSRIA